MGITSLPGPRSALLTHGVHPAAAPKTFDWGDAGFGGTLLAPHGPMRGGAW